MCCYGKIFCKRPHISLWKKGARVKGDTSIKPGTAIATFNSNGKFKGHTAIYISQTAAAINVYDQ